jgi:RHS repeat-associated protein
LADPLGTKRVQANVSGVVEEHCLSLPFGNDLTNPLSATCIGSDDATEHHFTQKERDNESGNDYFFARYYTSALGRFTTPDWSAKVTPVPYAQLGDPQSLNLYAYVRNNPLTLIDVDGHDFIQDANQDWIKQHQITDLSGKFGAELANAAGLQMAQPQSPDPNLPVNRNYNLVVLNDSGPKMDENDGRDVQYSLRTADPTKPLGGDPGVKTDDIQEHLSNPHMKKQESHEANTGLFHDSIGPGGKQGRGYGGVMSTDRYFTVVLNGTSLGVIPIRDAFGTHVVDHIQIDFTHDRTILNGHTGDTSVP